MARRESIRAEFTFEDGEEVRLKFAEKAASTEGINFGGTREAPLFQLLPLSICSRDEITRAVRVTADRARKSWTELRAALRYFDVRFLILNRDREVALLRRHPEYRPKRLLGWLAESERLSGRRPEPASLDLRVEHIERTQGDITRRLRRLEAQGGDG